MTPWYREPWPWIVMAPPAAAVLAGLATIWIAVASSDGLVAEDYYKQGLAINQVIAREERARALGIAARIEIGDGRLRVRLEGASPPALFVHLAHRTRAGFDQRLRLAPVAGVYEAEMAPLAPGGWRARIEDPRGEWRITQEAL
ncbi:MAG: FixH family protein [Betaproteobacteria bacterium]|nr:FixH family protein [Betaproteobacteria bacterium]MDH4324111.1 FixH family protein [Betaproteobacteria bacterium]MDH5211886.1 FixH family protein [Betaproteobacteria bacterium]